MLSTTNEHNIISKFYFLMHWLFIPTIWLSNQLSFSRKYLLIGSVVLTALIFLSWPLLNRIQNDIQLINTERFGLQRYLHQIDLLIELITARNESIGRKNYSPNEKLINSLNKVTQIAYQDGLMEYRKRLPKIWEQIQEQDPDEICLQLCFATYTGTINILINLIKDSSRIYRLNIDSELDSTLDMLINRLPLVMDTLGKQRDALMLNNEAMATYAVGAQVILTESILAIKTGILQLTTINSISQDLNNITNLLLSGINQQQDFTDIALSDLNGTNELKTIAATNIKLVQKLLNHSIIITDSHLINRMYILYSIQWLVTILLFGTIFIIAYLFVGIYLSTLHSLKTLSNGTAAFCGGKLDARININTKDELVLIARNFNTVATEVEWLIGELREQNESRERELEWQVQARTAELAEKNEQLKIASKRVQQEILLARNMQLAILPQYFPNETTWAAYAVMLPALELSGDFYDWFLLPDGRCGILVADVSGKGVGAAFFMAVSRTVLLDIAMSGDNPAQVLARSNDLLCERNPMELFVTVCYGIFDSHNGSFIYANAGHLPPLLRQISSEVKRLFCSNDIALGIMPTMEYINHSIVIEHGEILLLYTDGVTEANSIDGSLYGDNRLYVLLASITTQCPDEVIKELLLDVKNFTAEADASDDITCLVLSRKNEEMRCDTSIY